MNTSTEKIRSWNYSYLRKKAPRLEGWRTPGRTKALVAVYFAALAIAVITWLTLVFGLINVWWFLGFYVGAIIASMVAYSMLRMTIDAKDSAPSQELDDYEQEVLDEWRVKGHRLAQTTLFVGGFFFVFAGSFLIDSVEPAVLIISAGLYMIFSYLVVGTLPVVGFAATFNQNCPEDALDTEEKAN